MLRNTKLFILFILPLFVFSSCTKDKNDVLNNVKPKERRVSIGFSGSSQIAPNQPKAFEINPKEGLSNGQKTYNAKINYVSIDGQTIKVKFALIAVANNTIVGRDSFTANAIVKVTDANNNVASLDFPHQTVKLKESIVKKHPDAEWYVAGIIGATGDFNKDYGITFEQPQSTKTISKVGGKLTGDITTSNIGISAFEAEKDGKVQLYDVPLVCPWTKVDRHKLTQGQSFQVVTTFDPQGMLVALNLQSELHEVAILTAVEIKTNAFTSNVTFDFGAFDTTSQEQQKPTAINDGSSIVIDGTSSIEHGYTNIYKIANVEVDPNSPTTKQVYIWVMPRNGGGYNTTNKGIISISTQAISKTAITNNTIQPNSDGSYSSKLSYSPERVLKGFATSDTKTNPFMSGKNLTLNVKMQSDLMMTEYLQYDDNGNKGILELYNPTNHSIDLSNYKLVRTEGVTRGSNETYYFQGEGYKGRDIILGNAIAQDLYIDHAGEPYGNVTHLNGKPWGNNCNRRKNMYTDNQPNTQMLEPGKCILVFAGYYVQNDAKPKAKILNDIHTNIYSDRIQSNIDNGKCQIAVAFDNGKTLNGWSDRLNSGTMQKQRNQGFILVKGKKPIDAFAPGTSANEGDWKIFTNASNQGNKTLIGVVPLIWVRNSYSLYPNLNFTINSLDNNGKITNVPTNHEWFFVTEDEFNSESKYMTPGRRSQWQ